MQGGPVIFVMSEHVIWMQLVIGWVSSIEKVYIDWSYELLIRRPMDKLLTENFL